MIVANNEIPDEIVIKLRNCLKDRKLLNAHGHFNVYNLTGPAKSLLQALGTDWKPGGGILPSRENFQEKMLQEICYRLARRIIQIERKAGNIKLVNQRNWVWVGPR